MKHTYKFLGLLLFLSFMGVQTTSAHAACSNPAGVEGEQIYNDDNNVMQFCDGTDWTAMKGSDLTSLNATTLDTIDSTQFLRSDVDDIADGGITFRGLNVFTTDVNDQDFIVRDSDKGSVSNAIWYDYSSGITYLGNQGGSGSAAEVYIRGKARLSTEGTAADHLVTKGYVDAAVSGAGADNLGDHTATQDIDLATHKIVGNGGASGISIGSSGNVTMGDVILGNPPTQLLGITINSPSSTGVRFYDSDDVLYGSVSGQSDGTFFGLYSNSNNPIIQHTSTSGRTQFRISNSLEMELRADQLDLRTNKITNLADPTSAQDAATKAYVDANAGGGADDLGDHTATTNLLMGSHVLDYGEVGGNKALWFSNLYGTGIETNTLTNWSAGNHRWRIGGTSTSTGTQRMLLNNTGLDVNGSVTATNFVGSGAGITAINGDNITDNTIDGSEIQNESITSADIDNGTITAADLASNSVEAAEIATGAVGASEIAAGAVRGSEIQNGSIVATTELSATGTKNATTFLRGDNTWAIPAGGAGCSGGRSHMQVWLTTSFSGGGSTTTLNQCQNGTNTAIGVVNSVDGGGGR